VGAPIISGVEVSPDPVPTGQQATITVAAFDPDGKQVLAEAMVVDSAGQVATKSFTFTVSDTLTYAVTVDSGVVTQDPSDPSVFIWSL